jgi:hypothetical protein
MSALVKMAATGGAVAKTYVDDVFSAYTYTGNGATQTINNGIDLAGKGGLIWNKLRSTSASHYLFDSSRNNFDQVLLADSAANATNLNVFNVSNTGIDLLGAALNNANQTYVNWTFRKAPKFFDVVAWTGNNVAGRQISHKLGIAPGFIVFKRIDIVEEWGVYHVNMPENTSARLNSASLYGLAQSTLISSVGVDTFTITNGKWNSSGNNSVNDLNGQYIAYLFAHDPSADGIIQCGSFTTDSNGSATVNLGWEPQYLMTKATSFNDGWQVKDTARGLPVGAAAAILYPNTSESEQNSLAYPHTLTATGVSVKYEANQTYIYMAIRRPNKPPIIGTQVYNAVARTGTASTAKVTGVGFAPDLFLSKSRAQGVDVGFFDRLRGNQRILCSSLTGAELLDNSAPNCGVISYDCDGVTLGIDGGYGRTNVVPYAYINHLFKRAPGFLDLVCYTGNSSGNRTISHNLSVIPELVIFKGRNDATYNWTVHCYNGVNNNNFYGNAGTGSSGLNSSAAADYSGGTTNVLGTNAVLSVGEGQISFNVNKIGTNYVAYLFASLPGVSKVGRYAGNGSSQTINCGFSNGARFILVKRTDAAGDWYVWDSVRGISDANDPHISLNSTAAEVTADDSIDPAPSGFAVNQNGVTNINVLNGTYIYLAIA